MAHASCQCDSVALSATCIFLCICDVGCALSGSVCTAEFPAEIVYAPPLSWFPLVSEAGNF
jgi:hypothetical protein